MYTNELSQAMKVHESGEVHDDYAEQVARQNRGLWCQGCGAISGHYDFCRTINGGNHG